MQKIGNRRKAYLLGILVLLLTLGTALRTQAATTSMRLFYFVVTDAAGNRQKLPIYEYKTGTNITVGAKKGYSTLTVNIGSGTATMQVKGKTDYYKKNYKSVMYLQKLGLSGSSGKKTFIVRAKDGTERKFQLTFRKPEAPKLVSVDFNKSCMLSTGDEITITGDISSETDVTAILKIKNSSGKVVYRKNQTVRANEDLSVTWDGKPSKGNAAGASVTSALPAGSYKAVVYLKYKYGEKTKTVSSNGTFQIAATKEEASAINNAWSEVSWPWTMYITGDDTLDYVAEVICREILTPEMTQVQRAKALYDYIAAHFKYHSGIPSGYASQYPVKISTTSKTAQTNMNAFAKCLDTLTASGKAKKVTLTAYFDHAGGYATWAAWGIHGLTRHVGDCCIIANCYTILLRHAGIQADMLEHAAMGVAGHHFWNVVKIGGSYYMADADQAVEGGGSTLGYTYFLRGQKFAKSSGIYGSLNSYSGYKKLFNQMASEDCPGRV